MKTEPKKALEWIDFMSFFNTESESIYIDDYEAIRAAKIAFREGQSNPLIKALDWNYDENKNIYVDTIFGKYEIIIDFLKINNPPRYYETTAIAISPIYYLKINGISIRDYESPLDAIKTAQEDFNSKIMEYIVSED